MDSLDMNDTSEYSRVSSDIPLGELVNMVTQRIKELESLSQTGEVPGRRLRRDDSI